VGNPTSRKRRKPLPRKKKKKRGVPRTVRKNIISTSPHHTKKTSTNK